MVVLRGLVLVGVFAALLAVAAPAALAATVSVEPPRPWATENTLRYTAADGEANELTLRFLNESRTSVRVVDQGAVIEPGPTCRAVGPHVVDCAVHEGVKFHFHYVAATLGDGDDSFRFLPFRDRRDLFSLAIDGGPGADTLRGVRQGFGELRGGDGPDRLTATYESTALFLHGDGDDDELIAGASGDEMNGGAGRDRLVGGDGADHLYGDEKFGDVDPDDADDTLEGGGGNDVLRGGEGVDAVKCGAGTDSNAVDARADVVPFDCETVTFVTNEEFGTALSMAPRPFAAAGGALLFRVPCAETQGGTHYDVPIPCRGSLTLRQVGTNRLLGSGLMPRDVGSVRLTPLGRVLARRRFGVLATVTLKGDQLPPPSGWTFRLRRSS